MSFNRKLNFNGVEILQKSSNTDNKKILEALQICPNFTCRGQPGL